MFREAFDTPQKDDGNEERGAEEAPAQMEHAPRRAELASLDTEKQKEVTDRALAIFRDVLGPRADYAVMASTAMYLHGRELERAGDERGKDLDVTPGDFDALVASKDALDDIRTRLSKVPGIEFDNDGKYGHFLGQPTEILSGTVDIRTETPEGSIVIPYDFEFFHQTRIAGNNAMRDTKQLEGLPVLGFEGLMTQYKNNLELESRVEAGVEKVAAYLTEPAIAARIRGEIEAGNLSPETEEDLQRLDISAEQAGHFYRRQDEIDLIRKNLQEFPQNEALQKNLQDQLAQRAIILAGLKTKVAKRELNVGQLAALLGRSV